MTFKDHLERYLSKEEIDSLIKSFDDEEVKGLYLNESKLSKEDLLKRYPFLEKNEDVKNGYIYLNSENRLGSSLFFHLGAFYIQDPSAMLVGEFLPLDEGDIILDMCSAPGGKLTEVSLRLLDKGMIVANDVSSSRASALLENVERMGLDNVIVTCSDYRYIYKDYPSYFSKIILDAPCSGSGMFRKDEKMKDDWSYNKVLKYQETQKELVDTSLYMLKDGGYLIYSTCSYSYEEDEEIVSYILSKGDMELIDLPSVKGEYRPKGYEKTMHLFPYLHKGEGQYIALFKKKGTLINSNLIENHYIVKGKNKGDKPIQYEYKLNMEINPNLLKHSLRPGTLVSTSYLDYSNRIYSHHFARTLSKNSPLLMEISLEDTLKYMEGNTLNLNLKDGDYFLSYLGMSVGYLKAKGGQNKNHFPKGLRKRYYL